MGANKELEIPKAQQPDIFEPVNTMGRSVDLIDHLRDEELLTPLVGDPRPLPSSHENSPSRASHDMMTLPPPTE